MGKRNKQKKSKPQNKQSKKEIQDAGTIEDHAGGPDDDEVKIDDVAASASTSLKRGDEPPSSSDDDLSSEDEGDDMILEGVLVRNAEVDSSDDDSDSSEEEEEPRKKKAKTQQNQKSNNKQQQKGAKPKPKSDSASSSKKKSNEPETIDVEFTFNDMKENYFHGIKNFLLRQQIYSSNSSPMADLILENVSVGTVISTDDGEDNVFGFASVLNVGTTKGSSIDFLQEKCLEYCPAKHKKEMETVLSGKTKRPAGFYIHGRMVNLPLEITLVLHEQLVQDMDWAVDNAEGGEDERKSLNFGAFVLFAPCSINAASQSFIYKNFDDEIFAGCAEFVYSIDSAGLKTNKSADKAKGDSGDDEGESNLVNVIVLTKTGHREAMKELSKMING